MDEIQGSPPATGSLTVVEETPPPDEGPKHRWYHYTLPGAWVALVFVSLSFTPSLLPRSGLFDVGGWAAVLQPDGWSSGDAAELREIVLAEPDG